LREYNALGAVGRPVYTAAPQLRATVKRMLGQDRADMLAIPQINEAGDTIDWYAPDGAMVVPWTAASEEERAPARQALQQARLDFQARSASLLGQGGGNEDAEVFARMLPLALHIPDESHIHLVNGRPVVTFWGFTRLDAPAEGDVIRDLGLRPPPPPPSPPAAAAAPVAAPVPAVAVPWWRRWWWLLLLLLLLPLLLLLFGLRSCGVDVPVPGLPAVSVPALEAPQVTVPGVTVPGVVVPGGGVADGAGGSHLPNAVLPDNPGAVLPAGDKTHPDAVPPKAEPPSPKNEANTPPSPPKGETGVPPKAEAAVPPPPPLTLPDKAMKDGKADFLNGHWRSRTGLMDSQTGRPLEVEYDFKDGKGTATILRSDGSKCAAPVEAAVKGGKLMLDQTAAARCADGQVFDRSRVECRQGKAGKAECQGVNADGGGYSVEIVK
jgi:hypothetical protein